MPSISTLAQEWVDRLHRKLKWHRESLEQGVEFFEDSLSPHELEEPLRSEVRKILDEESKPQG